MCGSRIEADNTKTEKMNIDQRSRLAGMDVREKREGPCDKVEEKCRQGNFLY